MSFTGGSNHSYPNGGPAFWALDIEHTSVGPYSVGWPAGTTPAWNSGANYAAGNLVSYSGQVWISAGSGNVGHAPPAAGVQGNSFWTLYNDFFEVDFMEYDAASNTYPAAYQNGIGNWYNNNPTLSTSNPQNIGAGVGTVSAPAGTDFSKPHKYGCLWVPATGSGVTTTTQGYLIFYFDDVQTGATFYWDYYNPSDASYPSPQPSNEVSAMSGMDWRHMFMILGSDVNQPTTVQSVNVWQTSAANNLVY
jgi:hypothetical protein